MKLLEKIVNSEITRGFTQIVSGLILAVCLYNSSAYAQESPKETTALPVAGVDLRWSPDGKKLVFKNNKHSLYIKDGPNLRKLTEYPVYFPAWSPDSTYIAFLSDKTGNAEIYIINTINSREINLTQNPASDGSLEWSPDGKKIVFVSEREGNKEIYLTNIDGTGQINLTRNPSPDHQPGWSPDGKKIVFKSIRPVWKTRGYDIYTINIDGTELRNLTNSPTTDDINPEWSPNGDKIAFLSDRDGNGEVYIMNPDGSNQINLTKNPAIELLPKWSPDSKKIAFLSNRDGNVEIYIMNADGTNQTNITNNPFLDIFSCWSPDGNAIIGKIWLSKTEFQSFIYPTAPDSLKLFVKKNIPIIIIAKEEKPIKEEKPKIHQEETLDDLLKQFGPHNTITYEQLENKIAETENKLGFDEIAERDKLTKLKEDLIIYKEELSEYQKIRKSLEDLSKTLEKNTKAPAWVYTTLSSLRRRAEKFKSQFIPKDKLCSDIDEMFKTAKNKD